MGIVHKEQTRHCTAGIMPKRRKTQDIQSINQSMSRQCHNRYTHETRIRKEVKNGSTATESCSLAIPVNPCFLVKAVTRLRCWAARLVSLLLRPSRRKRKPLLIMSPGVWVKMVAWGKVEGVGDRFGWMKD